MHREKATLDRVVIFTEGVRNSMIPLLQVSCVEITCKMLLNF